jgi:tripartite-type tricarboxylate transporter receptor subunit TctC
LPPPKSCGSAVAWPGLPDRRYPRQCGLNAAINESVKSAEIVAALAKLGAEVRTGSAEEFGAFLARERDKWVDVVTRTGIKAE